MDMRLARNKLKEAWPADFGADLGYPTPHGTVQRGDITGSVYMDPCGWRFHVTHKRTGVIAGGFVATPVEGVDRVRAALDQTSNA